MLLLLGAPAAPAAASEASEAPLLVLVEDGDGARLELAQPPADRGAVLLLGLPLGLPPPAGLALEPWARVELGAEPLGRRSLPLGPARTRTGLAAQVLARGADGTARFSNVVELGSALSPGAEQSGEVVVTELMVDPARVPDARGEWIELTSTLAHRVDLAGWTLRDAGTDLHVIEPAGPLWIGPGERLVLANEGDPARNGGVRADYAYGSSVLANHGDTVRLIDRRGRLVDEVVYAARAWPLRPGRSLSLATDPPCALANDAPASWCSSTSLLPSGDRGTPGAPNDRCP